MVLLVRAIWTWDARFFYSFSDEMTNSFKNPKCKYLQNFETDGFAILSIFKRYTQKNTMIFIGNLILKVFSSYSVFMICDSQNKITSIFIILLGL